MEAEATVRTLKQGPSAEAPRHYWEAQQDSAGAPRHYWSRSEIGIGLEQPPGEGSVAAQVRCLGSPPLRAYATYTAAGQQHDGSTLDRLHGWTRVLCGPHMVWPGHELA